MTVQGQVILLQIAPQTLDWIVQTLPKLIQVRITNLLVRLTVLGDFVWAKDDPKCYLDADAFGVPLPEKLFNNFRSPTGDGVTGGNFEAWFWLKLDIATQVKPPLKLLQAQFFSKNNPVGNPVATPFELMREGAGPGNRTGVPL